MEFPVTSAFLASDCVGRTIDGRFTLLRWLGGTEQSSVFLIELEGDPPKKAAIKLTPANADDAETRIAQCAVAVARRVEPGGDPGLGSIRAGIGRPPDKPASTTGFPAPLVRATVQRNDRPN